MTQYYDTTTSTIISAGSIRARGLPENTTVLAPLGIFPYRVTQPKYDTRLYYLDLDSQGLEGDTYLVRLKAVPKPPETMDAEVAEAAMHAADRARAAADVAVEQYIRMFSDVERQTWPKQQAEVDAYTLDPTAKTPTLDGLAAARGISRDVMLAKATEKVLLFEQLSIAVVGRQQAYEDKIKALAGSDLPYAERLDTLADMEFSYGPDEPSAPEGEPAA